MPCKFITMSKEGERDADPCREAQIRGSLFVGYQADWRKRHQRKAPEWIGKLEVAVL